MIGTQKRDESLSGLVNTEEKDLFLDESITLGLSKSLDNSQKDRFNIHLHQGYSGLRWISC